MTHVVEISLIGCAHAPYKAHVPLIREGREVNTVLVQFLEPNAPRPVLPNVEYGRRYGLPVSFTLLYENEA